MHVSAKIMNSITVHNFDANGKNNCIKLVTFGNTFSAKYAILIMKIIRISIAHFLGGLLNEQNSHSD